MKNLLVSVIAVAILCACPLPATAAQEPAWRHTELRRFKAVEAHQGVAVDAAHFYTISNREIGKYRKESGQRVAGWKGEPGGPIVHLNAGFVAGGKLHCAHSNFPAVPEESSVEIFDTATMTHVGSHRFDRPPGSLTWIVRRDGAWFACFAHYRKTSDPARSRVVKFDAEWRELAAWSFPPALTERFAGNSSSGGAFGPGGHLFVTGHDARELYVLDPPGSGTELAWRATIPVSTAGQAFDWDPMNEEVLYSIERKSREVVASWIEESRPRQAAPVPGVFTAVRCEGVYPRHLQGITTDGCDAVFWSWTDVLARTGLDGRMIKHVQAVSHQGDPCFHQGKLYVAVNLGKFNEPPGRADSWVYAYDGLTLAEVGRYPVREAVHGAGGIACKGGRFFVVGGLPLGVNENYVYEYDAGFRFLRRHVLDSGPTRMGIQTAAWAAGSWWFGCYGEPRVLLRADETFHVTGRWAFDASYGIEGLPDGRLLLARNMAIKAIGHAGRLVIGRADPVQGILLEPR